MQGSSIEKAVDKVIVLDFGSQYTHLLARRIRELGVFSEIMLPTASSSELRGAKGIILSGGPASVYGRDAPEFNPEVFRLGIPLLGLCYGQQLMGQEMGGRVEPGKVKEYGVARLENSGRKLFEGLPKNFLVWMSHGDRVSVLPKGFSGEASTQDCEFAAISDDKGKMYGLQFHPEVTHTEHGLEMLSNFVFGVCGCSKGWTMRNYLGIKIGEIKKQADGKKVFLLLSGGVDSTVCLALLGKALGPERVFALHVDTGFMRKGESALVKKEIEKLGIKKVHLLNAEKEFLEALDCISEPEEKRNIIGKLFIDLAMAEMEKLGFGGDGWLLGQGTIYPDTIETGATRNSNRIKTHHNRAPIVQKMIEEGKVIEPLNQLYKDEVRELGRLLALPEKLVNRHPFPGPGLAIRVLCSNGRETTVPGLQEAISKKIIGSGYSAILLPVKAVGVQGDNRTYRNAVLLQGPVDYAKIEEISTLITNSFNAVNRVVLLVSKEKAGQIKLEEAYLDKGRIGKLREADAIAMDETEKAGLMEEIWQFPVVLLPIDFGGKGEGIVLRPVSSREAMTAKFYPVPENALRGMAEKIMKVKGAGAVMLDVTHKPPATIEWE
ncbi:GMP synthase [glutamine-hydrolyzing] subunit B [uncultured archaeon]|nr:GMP synthase [glutamine-hydrolyzing] subunit B [uncultured archaeon]